MSRFQFKKRQFDDVSRIKFILVLLVCVLALTLSIPSLARYKNYVNLEAMFNEVQTWDGTVATGFNNGTGTEEDPYIITNSTQLDQIRYDLDAYYKLANNIDYMIKNETTVEDVIKSMLCYKREIYLDLREFNIANINNGCDKAEIVDKYGNILYEKDLEILFSLGYFFYKKDVFLHNIYDVKRHIFVN